VGRARGENISSLERLVVKRKTSCAEGELLTTRVKCLYAGSFSQFLLPVLAEHLPIRAFGKKDAFIPWLFTANPFYFSLTTATEKVKANAISIGFNQFAQARSQLGILSIR
jgi:hypothetical protein